MRRIVHAGIADGGEAVPLARVAEVLVGAAEARVAGRAGVRRDRFGEVAVDDVEVGLVVDAGGSLPAADPEVTGGVAVAGGGAGVEEVAAVAGVCRRIGGAVACVARVGRRRRIAASAPASTAASGGVVVTSWSAASGSSTSSSLGPSPPSAGGSSNFTSAVQPVAPATFTRPAKTNGARWRRCIDGEESTRRRAGCASISNVGTAPRPPPAPIPKFSPAVCWSRTARSSTTSRVCATRSTSCSS